ncbi:unnamed protein product, partial [Musa acuminata subsp. malaccensis]|uniref:(wild Malaysian banana) hypothetical protein n=1 Tax=Musa acuminata subsp. malaccensis TaxID=214687 RepID=A0A804JZ56_MUSAM
MHKPACPKTLAYNMRLQQREKKIEKERRIKTIRERERERALRRGMHVLFCWFGISNLSECQ